jgi:hypothetical protein
MNDGSVEVAGPLEIPLFELLPAAEAWLSLKEKPLRDLPSMFVARLDGVAARLSIVGIIPLRLTITAKNEREASIDVC